LKVTTSRAFRRQHINHYGLGDFARFDDYFLYIHLNPAVRMAHVWGSLLGLLLLPWGLYALWQGQFWPVLLASAIYYGVGFVSHFVWDGIFFETSKYEASAAAEQPRQPFLQTYRSLIRLISDVLRGRYSEREKQFCSQYAQVLWVFDAQAPQPEIQASDKAPD